MLIAEPVQNVGGVMVPPDGYWQELRRMCDKYGILLCADEVICGFGRLGYWFGSERNRRACPDVITFAKGVTSAYAPLGGMIVRAPLIDRLLDSPIGMFTHGVTWGGHPLSTAIAVANITALWEEGVLDNVLDLEPYFRAGLDDIAARHRIVKEVRGAGYFYGIELMGDRETGREFNPEEKAGVCRDLLPRLLKENGLMTRADDRGPAMLMLSPPLVADREVLDDLLARVDATLDHGRESRRRRRRVTRGARRGPEPRPTSSRGCARTIRRGSRRSGPRRTRPVAATSATRSTSAASSRSATTACAPAATAACAPPTVRSSATA